MAIASVALVDMAMNGLYFYFADRMGQLLIVVPENLLFLALLNGFVALRLYAPIYRFIINRSNPASAQEALARLAEPAPTPETDSTGEPE